MTLSQLRHSSLVTGTHLIYLMTTDTVETLSVLVYPVREALVSSARSQLIFSGGRASKETLDSGPEHSREHRL